jgi:DNA-binding NarL/FixJ family response regulator
MKTITIIDDSYMDCLLLNAWFKLDKRYQVIKEYNSGVDAIKESENLQSDFCIIDSRMPLLNGIETTILLLQKGYKGKIVVVSHAYYHDYRQQSQIAGAHGYCSKDKNSIFDTLAKIEIEHVSFDESKYGNWKKQTEAHKLKNKDIDTKIGLLNPHHKKILLYSCKGLNTVEISELMDLKKHTVEQYRAAMLQLLGFNSMGQAIAWAIASHIINHSDVITPPYQKEIK